MIEDDLVNDPDWNPGSDEEDRKEDLDVTTEYLGWLIPTGLSTNLWEKETYVHNW